MNTDTAPFSLDLARRFNWTLRTKDGRKAEIKSFDAWAHFKLIGLKYGDDTTVIDSWGEDGRCYSDILSPHDLLLSLDPADPAYRAAVQAAHDAGEKVCYGHGDGKWLKAETPSWSWNSVAYRLAQHCPAPKPAWTLPAPPKGRKWHRDDWEESMLPIIDGKQTRPLLDGEFARYGDQYRTLRGESWTTQHHDDSTPELSVVGLFVRTTRPLPAAPVVRPWNCAADVPGPVCWLRSKQREAWWSCLSALIICKSDVSVTVQTATIQHLRWDEPEKVAKLEYSTTCRDDDWHPLTTEAP